MSQIVFNATVKGVTANVAKKVVTVSMSFPMDDMTVADALAFYAGKMAVGVIVTPKQLTLTPDPSPEGRGEEDEKE